MKFKILLFVALTLPLYSQANDVKLKVALPNATEFSNLMMREKLRLIFNNIGYEIAYVELPLIRATTETQKGQYAITLVTISDIYQSDYQSYLPENITLSDMPFMKSEINFYSLNNKKIDVKSVDWIKKYKLGIARSINTMNIKADTTHMANRHIQRFTTNLSAFKALEMARVDIVASNAFSFENAKSALTNPEKIRRLLTIGTSKIYIGFSDKHFGREKVQNIVQLFDREMNKLTSENIKSTN